MENKDENVYCEVARSNVKRKAMVDFKKGLADKAQFRLAQITVNCGFGCSSKLESYGESCNLKFNDSELDRP